MKKISIGFFVVIIGLFLVIGGVPSVCAQEGDIEEFTLEEITVTAEKRAANLQELPSSVVVLDGTDLLKQGRITTEQILEIVPNLTYRYGGGPNPLGNISVRGIQRTQEAGGTQEVLPSSTAIYVDGVYLGIGGTYDVDRVEVLRGPQGTLYGRSATGGVVAFHTNNPRLSELGVNGSFELGTASLKNAQATVNIPASDFFAFRAAAHYLDRNGYYEAKGGQTTTKEGRIKALFQPNDALGVVLSLSAQETTNWGGGYTATLTGPNEIDYEGMYSVAEEGAAQKYRQAAINLNYDLGESTLTYIGGYHDYDYTGLGAEAVKEGKGHRDLNEWPTDYYHTEEIRLASDTEGQISWLVGANYFKHKFDTSIFSTQTIYPEDPELPPEEGYLVPLWGRQTLGTFENFGVFTEETFKVQDNFRITAGLRYDKTKLIQSIFFYQNQNKTTLGNSKNPPIYTGAGYAELIDDKHDYDNVTYKLRFEYDVTPDNMLYFLTASGFMPGYTSLQPVMGPPGTPTTWGFIELKQQQLTSYEFGTKNQFLDNTLRLNGAVFYYDYEGYPEAYNLRKGEGPPAFTLFAVPLRVQGLEVEMEYLITMYDKLSLSGGYQDIKITEFPSTATFVPMGPGDPDVVPGRYALMLEELPGHSPLKATLGYDHTFAFGDGSTLVPRAELVYTGGYYLSQMTFYMTNLGEKPHNYQSSYVLANIGATWTSANDKYGITAYVRNALDEEYKAGVSLNSTSLSPIGVTPGDPRTIGVMFNVKF